MERVYGGFPRLYTSRVAYAGGNAQPLYPIRPEGGNLANLIYHAGPKIGKPAGHYMAGLGAWAGCPARCPRMAERALPRA